MARFGVGSVFRSHKNNDGTVSKYPVGQRQGARKYIQDYTDYWSSRGNADIASVIQNMAIVLSKGESSSSEIMENLRRVHRALLGGVDLEAFHDLSLADPTFEYRLLTTMRTSGGDPLTSLKVFDGSRISGLVNIVSTKTGSENNKDVIAALAGIDGLPDKQSGLSQLVRLQVIPIGDNIYMSLSTKGGFYYRQGDILVPFNRLTDTGLLAEVNELIKEKSIEDAIKKIKEFNEYIDKSEEKIKDTGNLPDQIPVAAIYNRSSDGQNNPDNGKPKGKDQKPQGFSTGGFIDYSVASPIRQKLNSDEAVTATGRLINWGVQMPPPKDGRPQGWGGGVASRIALFSYAADSTPEEAFDLLNDPNPDASERAALDKLRSVITNRNAQETIAKNLIDVFKRNYRNLDSLSIPNDPLAFTNYVQDPANVAVSALWNQFMSPENQGIVSANYKRFYGNDADFSVGSTGRGITKSTSSSASSWNASSKKKKDWSSAGGSQFDASGNLRVGAAAFSDITTVTPAAAPKQVSPAKASTAPVNEIQLAQDLKSTIKVDGNSAMKGVRGSIYQDAYNSTVSDIARAISKTQEFVGDETGIKPPKEAVASFIAEYVKGGYSSPAKYFGSSANSVNADEVAQSFLTNIVPYKDEPADYL